MKITSKYGWRTFTLRGRRITNFHHGADVRSPLGAPVVALFDGVVVKVTRGRGPGARIGQPHHGVPAHASTLSGNAVTIERADGSAYVENHLDPAVEVGDQVRAGRTVLGHTDDSGDITAPHRHIELWRDPSNPRSYYDPTPEIRDAAGRRGSATAPATPRRAPTMFVTKFGSSRFVLVTGDRAVYVGRETYDTLGAAGIPTVALPNAEVEKLLASLVVEGQ